MARHVVVFLLLAAVSIVSAQDDGLVFLSHRINRRMPLRCGHVTTYSSLQPRFLGGISLRGGTIFTFGTQPRSLEVIFQESSRMNDLESLLQKISERDTEQAEAAPTKDVEVVSRENNFGDGEAEWQNGRMALAEERSLQHARAMVFQMHPLALIGHRIAEMDRMLELRSQLLRAGEPFEGSNRGELSVTMVSSKDDVAGSDRMEEDFSGPPARGPVDTFVSQSSLFLNHYFESASLLNVVLVGALLGGAFGLLLRLALVCAVALWEWCPEEEEAMVLILTNAGPDEKETPLLYQGGEVEDVESRAMKVASDYKPPVAPEP